MAALFARCPERPETEMCLLMDVGRDRGDVTAYVRLFAFAVCPDEKKKAP